jgi:hypothetical protein
VLTHRGSHPAFSITAAGRQVVDQASVRRRALIAGVLRQLPAGQQRAVAEALAVFAAAAGEIPDSQWPQIQPDALPGAPTASGREPARAGREVRS